MMRIWNYLFYFQWKLLNTAGTELIQKPLFSLVSLFVPAIKAKRDSIEKTASSFMNNKRGGANLGFAFNFMMITTAIIFGIFLFYITLLIGYKVRQDFIIFLLSAVVLSYLTNYFALWRNDNYLKYFNEFEKIKHSKIGYLYLLCFHMVVYIIAIWSVWYWR